MNCREARKLIHETLDGMASQEAEQRLREHLDQCAGCTAVQQRFAHWEHLLRAPDPLEPDESYFAEMARSIAAEIRKRETRRLSRPAPSWALSWGMAAACLLIGVGIGHVALPRTVTRTKTIERRVEVPGPVREVSVPRVVVREVRVPVLIERTRVRTVVKRIPAPPARAPMSAERASVAERPALVSGAEARDVVVSAGPGIGAARPFSYLGATYAMAFASDRAVGVTPRDIRLLARRLRSDMSNVDEALGTSALAATLASDMGRVGAEEAPAETPSPPGREGME